MGASKKRPPAAKHAAPVEPPSPPAPDGTPPDPSAGAASALAALAVTSTATTVAAQVSVPMEEPSNRVSEPPASADAVSCVETFASPDAESLTHNSLTEEPLASSATLGVEPSVPSEMMDTEPPAPSTRLPETTGPGDATGLQETAAATGAPPQADFWKGEPSTTLARKDQESPGMDTSDSAEQSLSQTGSTPRKGLNFPSLPRWNSSSSGEGTSTGRSESFTEPDEEDIVIQEDDHREALNHGCEAYSQICALWEAPPPEPDQNTPLWQQAAMRDARRAWSAKVAENTASLRNAEAMTLAMSRQAMASCATVRNEIILRGHKRSARGTPPPTPPEPIMERAPPSGPMGTLSELRRQQAMATAEVEFQLQRERLFQLIPSSGMLENPSPMYLNCGLEKEEYLATLAPEGPHFFKGSTLNDTVMGWADLIQRRAENADSMVCVNPLNRDSEPWVDGLMFTEVKSIIIKLGKDAYQFAPQKVAAAAYRFLGATDEDVARFERRVRGYAHQVHDSTHPDSVASTNQKTVDDLLLSIEDLPVGTRAQKEYRLQAFFGTGLCLTEMVDVMFEVIRDMKDHEGTRRYLVNLWRKEKQRGNATPFLCFRPIEAEKESWAPWMRLILSKSYGGAGLDFYGLVITVVARRLYIEDTNRQQVVPRGTALSPLANGRGAARGTARGAPRGAAQGLPRGTSGPNRGTSGPNRGARGTLRGAPGPARGTAAKASPSLRYPSPLVGAAALPAPSERLVSDLLFLEGAEGPTQAARREPKKSRKNKTEPPSK